MSEADRIYAAVLKARAALATLNAAYTKHQEAGEATEVAYSAYEAARKEYNDAANELDQLVTGRRVRLLRRVTGSWLDSFKRSKP